jgi:RNA recognition motif-containing protein
MSVKNKSKEIYMNIFVGNLSPETTEDDLRKTFEAFGQVISVKLLRNRATGESNGIGFVGMAVSDEAQTAISELNGKNLKGNTIKVEEGKRKISQSSDQGKQEGFGVDRGDRDRRDSYDRGGRGDRDRRDSYDRGGRGDRDRRDSSDRGGRGGRRY